MGGGNWSCKFGNISDTFNILTLSNTKNMESKRNIL